MPHVNNDVFSIVFYYIETMALMFLFYSINAVVQNNGNTRSFDVGLCQKQFIYFLVSSLPYSQPVYRFRRCAIHLWTPNPNRTPRSNFSRLSSCILWHRGHLSIVSATRHLFFDIYRNINSLRQTFQREFCN